MANTVPPRSKIDKKFTWNAESVFPSTKAWEKELKQIVEDVSKIKPYQGRLAESPSVLLEALAAVNDLAARADIAFMYANFLYNVDTTDQQASAMRGRAQGMYGQVLSAVSFLQPEILEIGKETLDKWMSRNEKLAIYRNSFENLFRRQAHVRSAEVEELLGLVTDPLQGFQS